MDFVLVLRFLIKCFERESIDFALIGGFGLHAAGVMRSTRDIESLIRENRNAIDMELVREYFGLFNRVEELEDIMKRMEHA